MDVRLIITVPFQIVGLVLVLSFFSINAKAKAPGEMGEMPAFSDPSVKVNMGPGWLRKPVVHDDGWADGADIALTLDQHLFPALSPLVKKFAKNEGLKIAIQEGTCGISAGRLAGKQVDIGGFCCPPGDTDRLPGLNYHTLGISALAILVNIENPLEGLPLQRVRDIFRGDVYDWSKLITTKNKCNFHEPIRVLGRFHCKQRPGHWRLILADEDHFSLKTEELSTIEDMIAKIASLPGAIGYEVLWNIARHQATDKIKFLLVGRADPTKVSDVATANYPFYRVYNITTWSSESGVANKAATALVQYLITHVDEVKTKFDLVPASRLRQEGWIFKGDELIGEPASMKNKS